MPRLILGCVLCASVLGGAGATMGWSAAPSAAVETTTAKPVIQQLAQMPDHKVVVCWDKTSLPKDAKVRVHRDDGNGRMRAISREMKAGEGRYIDTDRKRAGTTCKYQLELLPAKGTSVVSGAEAITCTALQVPPAPAGLQGRFVRVDGRHYVELNWTNTPDSASGIDRFELFQLVNGTLTPESSAPVLRGNSCRLEITRQQDLDVTLGIAAVSAQRVRGEIALVNVHLPGTYFPAPAKVSAERQEDGTRIAWEYTAHDDLIGFRVFVNDAILLDERQVPAEARSATVQFPPDAKVESSLFVQAVSRYGTLSWRLNPQGKSAAEAVAKSGALPASNPAAAQPTTKTPFVSAAAEHSVGKAWTGGHSRLMGAASAGDVNVLKQCIAEGDDVNQTCRCGQQETALMFAVRGGDRGFECAKLLIEAGANANARFRGNWYTPAMIATRGKSPRCLKLLMDNGADLTLDNGRGATALDWAREDGNQEIIEILEVAGRQERGRK